MIHLGDITLINGSEVPMVDIVCGGSPCQDLSLAGKREGLSGQRSGLFMDQIRIIKEMREHDKRNRGTDVDIRFFRPRFMVWENVLGAFSSNGGEDFRAVLEETAKIVCEDAVIPRPPKGKWSHSGCIMGDGWSIAWRVHDAQFWGVPQRRKRISLVADFGGQSAPEILFECKGLSGDIEESSTERKGITETIERSSFETISFQERAGCDGGVRESLSKESEQEHYQPSTTNQFYQPNSGDNCQALLVRNVAVSIGNGQLHDAMTPSRQVSKTLNCMDDPAKIVVYSETVGTLNARDYKGVGSQYVEEDKLIIQDNRKPSDG